jgi:hypothetical protein
MELRSQLIAFAGLVLLAGCVTTPPPSGELLARSSDSSRIDLFAPHGIRPAESDRASMQQRFSAFVSDILFDRGEREDGHPRARLERTVRPVPGPRLVIRVAPDVPFAATDEIRRNLLSLDLALDKRVELRRGGEADIHVLAMKERDAGGCRTDAEAGEVRVPDYSPALAQSCVMRGILRVLGMKGWSYKLPSVFSAAEIRQGMSMADIRALQLLYDVPPGEPLWRVLGKAQKQASDQSMRIVFTGVFSGPPVEPMRQRHRLFGIDADGLGERPDNAFTGTLGRPAFNRYRYRDADGGGLLLDVFVHGGNGDDPIRPMMQLRETAPDDEQQHYNVKPDLPLASAPRIASFMNGAFACISFETGPRAFDGLPGTYSFLGKYCRAGDRKMTEDEAVEFVSRIRPRGFFGGPGA